MLLDCQSRHERSRPDAPRRDLGGDKVLVLGKVLLVLALRGKDNLWTGLESLFHIAVEIVVIDEALDGAQVDWEA